MGELEGSESVRQEQRGELSSWYPGEPSHHLEKEPVWKNRELGNTTQGQEDWNSESCTPGGIQPEAQVLRTCTLLRAMEEDAEA